MRPRTLDHVAYWLADRDAVADFAAAHLGAFTSDQLARYEALLDENDGDLFDWMTGRCAPPAEKMNDVVQLLLSFRYPGAG